MENKKCTLCEFETDNGRVFSNHIRWKHKEKPFSDEGYAKLCEKQPLVKRDCICPKCNNSFSKELENSEWRRVDREHGGVIFCSRKCANSKNQKDPRINDKRKNTLRQRYGFSRDKKFYCVSCGKEFLNVKTKKYCSRECLNLSKKRKTDDLTAYRNDCKFRFPLSQFPEEFDFGLVKEYGWYSAANHGDNAQGVSRDHMVSVKFGFTNKIDPAIIRHPANCRLILQKENFIKRDSCCLTIGELLTKIEEWNKRYGPFV